MEFDGDGIAGGVCVMVIQTFSCAAYLVALKLKMATHPYPVALQMFATLW